MVFFVDFFGCGFLVWLLRKLEQLVGVLLLVVDDLAISVFLSATFDWVLEGFRVSIVCVCERESSVELDFRI